MKKFLALFLVGFALVGAFCTSAVEHSAEAQTNLFGYSPETTLANVAAVQALTARPASVVMLGTNTAGDGGGGILYWVAGSTTTCDNVNTFCPTNGPAGRYLRLIFTSASGGSTSVGGDLTGTVSNATVAKINGSTPGYFALGTDASNLTGTVSVNRFNNGTNADSSHFLAGNGDWLTPPSASGAAIQGTPSAGQCATWYSSSAVQGVNCSTLINNITSVRQTVQAGPASSGLPSFLPPSAGSLSITSQNVSGSAPLIATAANGSSSMGALDVFGASTSNLTWSGLTASTTNYLYVTISGGSLAAGSTTVAPVYQQGGSHSTTSGAFTFDIGTMTGYLGNGTTAPQAYVVFVGEAVTSGSAVTSSVAYVYNGVYDSGFTTTLPSTSTVTSFSHNIGTYPRQFNFIVQCTTTDGTFAVGDQLSTQGGLTTAASVNTIPSMTAGRNTISVATAPTSAWQTITKTAGSFATLTLADWEYKLVASRGW